MAKKILIVLIFGVLFWLAVLHLLSIAFMPSKGQFNMVVEKLRSGEIKEGDPIRAFTDILGKETVLDNYWDRENDKEYINAIYIRTNEYLEFYIFDGKIFAARYCAGVSTNTSEWYILNQEMYSQYFSKWIGQ